MKRDIVKIAGEHTSAVNLDHVTSIWLQDAKIVFQFQNNSVESTLSSAEEARNAFEKILEIWGGEDVLE